jgi:UrcA family protein
MTKLPVLAAFAAMAAAPIAATHAEGNAVTRSEMVRYGDLDLNNQEGAVTLYRRLHNAAADVCSNPSEDRYSSVPDYQRCVEHAVGAAVASVDQPALTTYAEARGVLVASRQGGRPN